jgi:hypothetical protein
MLFRKWVPVLAQIHFRHVFTCSFTNFPMLKTGVLVLEVFIPDTIFST